MEYMDVCGSLRKLAKELVETGQLVLYPHTQNEVITKIEATAFMINWIADGLDREFELAAERGRRQQMKEIEK